jgi:ATP-dependent helicase/nuclease subunit B
LKAYFLSSIPTDPELVAAHPVEECWAEAMRSLALLIKQSGVHPSRTVVLLPYAQLMLQARQAWSVHALSATASAFVPRFETSMNWAASLSADQSGFVPAAGDIAQDAALDLPTAANLLQQAGLGAYQHLAGRLTEAAWSLSRVAAAQHPEQRMDWGQQLSEQLGQSMASSVLALELAVASIALVWAASSAYATDCLFEADVDLLVLLEGFQTEALSEPLKLHFGERAQCIKLGAPEHAGHLGLHAAGDMEDEAQRAAACVIAHLAEGRSPVALIAQDRVLTRRIRAMLAERGVVLRDETGWKLSTTRSAAGVMNLLRAVPWDASSDAVLEWLKNAPAFSADVLEPAEVWLRKAGLRLWRELPPEQEELTPLLAQLEPLRKSMQAPRPLPAWLRSLRGALQTSGQWMPMLVDVAGAAVMESIRLFEGMDAPAEDSPRLSLAEFTSWVNQALEAGSYTPGHPAQSHVTILPLSQLLGRPMQAVVMPGCDEIRLQASPEPPGGWTPAQRLLLGLPSREELAAAQKSAWQYALCMPHIDLLWRTSEAGESLTPSALVQLLLLHAPTLAPDPRSERHLPAQPTLRPLPRGQDLPVSRLSASAYEDLRRCPYRFFALRQLGLQPSDELEGELDKRDFGNWLHTLLHFFHTNLKTAPTQDLTLRIHMIDQAADKAMRELRLSQSEFLPFAASWPRVRQGYLEWLAEHEASGAVFDEGEVWRDVAYGKLTLFGKIDRIDRLPDGSRLLMDYKTEPRATTAQRIKDSREDTQLPFYAALLEQDTLAAAYVNLGEKEASRSYPQPGIVELRDEMIESLLSDMERIQNGAVLPALGEGKACDYCNARGLCRKDFWQ